MFDEKTEAKTRLKEDLSAPLRRMQEFARNIAKVSKESKLELSEQEYVESFKTGLMDAVYQWCKGAKFSEICKVRWRCAMPTPLHAYRWTSSLTACTL